MTLPYERYRSIVYARDFLCDLLDPKATPKVPSEIRQRARAVLRHFPFTIELDELAKKAPEIVDPKGWRSPVVELDTPVDSE